MQKAIKCLELNKLSASYVYGIGNSETVCAGVDRNLVKCWIAPDEFEIGYQSLDMISKKLSGSSQLNNYKVGFKVIRRENLFDEDNKSMFYYLLQ